MTVCSITGGNGAGKTPHTSKHKLRGFVGILGAAIVGVALCSLPHKKGQITIFGIANAGAMQAPEPRSDSTGLSPVRPEYPRASIEKREQGRVVLRVLISPEGQVTGVTVKQSSGYTGLDASAIKAARSARFKPYMENGVAHPAIADIPFDFILP